MSQTVTPGVNRGSLEEVHSSAPWIVGKIIWECDEIYLERGADLPREFQVFLLLLVEDVEACLVAPNQAPEVSPSPTQNTARLPVSKKKKRKKNPTKKWYNKYSHWFPAHADSVHAGRQ